MSKSILILCDKMTKGKMTNVQSEHSNVLNDRKFFMSVLSLTNPHIPTAPSEMTAKHGQAFIKHIPGKNL